MMSNFTSLVKQGLAAAPQGQDHPDANLLSGFAEKTLGAKERLSVLEHLAWCGSCREILSWSFPPATTTDPVVVVSKAGASWMRWPVLRWTAAAACLVVVGAVIILRSGHPKQAPQPGQLFVKTSSSAEKRGAGMNSFASTGPAPGGASAPRASQRLALPKTREENREDVGEEESAHGGASSHQTAEPTLIAEASAAPDTVPGRAKEPASTVAGSAELSRSEADLGRSGQAVPVPRWTLSSEGILQRSLDSGRTWQQMHLSTTATLRAVAANGLKIWVGGSGGALYRSDDAGEHWVQVRPLAGGEFLSADILGIELVDPLHVKLTAAGQQTWTTADAGQTWQK